jgi:hypothetical protein
LENDRAVVRPDSEQPNFTVGGDAIDGIVQQQTATRIFRKNAVVYSSQPLGPIVGISAK